MRPQGTQQWRPKAKVQCLSEPVLEAVKNTPALEPFVEDLKSTDHVMTVLEEPEKMVENIVSSSLEVNQTLVQSMKKQRGRLKRKIEAETKTSLSISKQKTGYCIVVEGATDAVSQATERLQNLLEKAGAKTQTQTQEKSGSAASTSSDAVKTSLKVQNLQWMPKAVRSLHTSVEAENVKESVQEKDDDAEIVSGAVQVDKKLLRLIKGHKNEIKQRIEKDTNTTIRIGSPVVVEGSEECVQKALDEIQRIIEEGVNDSKFQYSHFISLPLSIHPSLVKQLEDFQESVLSALEIPLTEGDQEQPVGDQEQPVRDQESEKVDEVLNQADQVEDLLFKKTVLTSLGVEPDQAEVYEDQTAVPDKSEEAVQAVEENGKENIDGVEKQDITADADQTEEVEVQVTEEAEVKVAEEETKEYEPLADVGFKAKRTGGNSGVERSIFIKPSRFHLTILMLKLWNEERVEKAREVLEACLPKVNEVLEGKPISVSLAGLEIMKGSPKNTRVLYAKVNDSDGEDRLSRACQTLIDAFVEAGLVLGKDQDQALKLHATLMNTSHRKSKSKYKNKGFDATEILARFGNEGWGDYQVLEAHLSERFKYDENDYYHCCGSIPFPQK